MLYALAAVCALSLTPLLRAQKTPPGTTAGPPTASSAQASPVRAVPNEPATATSVEASPVAPDNRTGIRLAPHTALPIRLSQGIDSGTLTNGQDVHAKLGSAVKTGPGHMLPAGTPVVLTVIATAPAGRIASAGEFSLELMRVGPAAVFTEVQTFRGERGAKDLADSASDKGTEAGLAAGAELTFHVQPPPSAATGPLSEGAATPGSVTGITNGGPPAAGSTPQPGAATGTPNIPSGNPPGRPEVAQHPADNAGGAVRRGAASSQPAAPQPGGVAPR